MISASRRMPLWFPVLLLVGIPLLCIGIPFLQFVLDGIEGNVAAGPCDEQERAEFFEVQHLAQVEVSTFEGSCKAIYQTARPPDEVIGHYRRQLEAKGWSVLDAGGVADAEAEGEQPGGSFTAQWGEHWYLVGYESMRIYENPPEGMERGTHVVVSVGKGQ